MNHAKVEEQYTSPDVIKMRNNGMRHASETRHMRKQNTRNNSTRRREGEKKKRGRSHHHKIVCALRMR